MKKLLLLLTPLLVLSLILGAIGCAGEEATPTPTPKATPTSTPKATPTLAPTPTPKPGETPGPTPKPTATPAPTATPQATPTPKPTATPAPTPTPEPIVLKLSMAYPDTHIPRGVQIAKIKELIEKYTDGRVQLELFLGGVLFPAKAEWEAVSTGAVDMSFTPPYYASQVVADYRVFYIRAGLWGGEKHGWTVINDPRVKKMFADQAWEKGVKQLGMFPMSAVSVVVSRDKEIIDYPDLEGMRFGALGVPLLIYTDYGKGIPVPVTSQEMYIALAQGLVGFVPTGLSSVAAFNLYEVADYLYITTAGYNTTMLWMNKDTWSSLPADIQDIIENEVMPEALLHSREMMLAATQAIVDEASPHLKGINWETPEQTARAVDFLRTYPKTLEELELFTPELLDIMDELLRAME